MKGGTLLLIVALFLGYLAVTGKYKCISSMLYCVFYADDPASCGCGGSSTATSTAGSQSGQDAGYTPPKVYTAPPYSGGTLPLNPMQ
jgi:hypothetical protein